MRRLHPAVACYMLAIAALFARPLPAAARLDALRDLGRLRANLPVRIGVLLRDRHERELATLVRQQGQRGSRYFHRYLTNAQWNAYFAPDPLTYARTLLLLERRGFRIDRTASNRTLIRAFAPASLAERYFGTELHAVRQARYGVRYRNVTPVVVPAELRPVAAAIAGLDATVHVATFGQTSGSRTYVGVAPARSSRQASATNTPQPNPAPDPTLTPTFSAEEDYTANAGYGPPIWAIEYNFPVQHGYGGRGEAVASVINADFADADAAAEMKLYQIPRTGRQFRVFTDGTFTSSSAGGAAEATLDAEVAESLAPAADFYEYLTQYFDALGIEGAYAQIVGDDAVAVVNSSFGACETDDPSFEYATNYIAMQGAVKGITFVASAGDAGSLGCGRYNGSGQYGTLTGVEVPCADVYFVCVGGTEFEAVTSPSNYTGEMAWTMGGGGVSVLEPLPDWQAQTPGIVTTGRNVPDLAFTADSNPPGVGFVAVIGGVVAGAGGTSVAAPMFAALQAEIDQAQQARNGFVNARLYAVGNAAQNFAFRDVTVGANPGYSAAAGYDRTTGFGSPLGFQLAGAE